MVLVTIQPVTNMMVQNILKQQIRNRNIFVVGLHDSMKIMRYSYESFGKILQVRWSDEFCQTKRVRQKLIFNLLAGLNATNGELELYDANKNSWNVVSNYSDYRLELLFVFLDERWKNQIWGFRSLVIFQTSVIWTYFYSSFLSLDSIPKLQFSYKVKITKSVRPP